MLCGARREYPALARPTSRYDPLQNFISTTNLSFQDGIKRSCVIRADLTGVAENKHEEGVFPYYTREFDVVLICGPELRAQVRWKENVSISPHDSSGHSTEYLLYHRVKIKGTLLVCTSTTQELHNSEF